MTFEVKIFYSQRLAAAPADLVPAVAAGKQVIIRSIILANFDVAGAHTVDLFVQKSGGSNMLILGDNSPLAVGAHIYYGSLLTLGPGDKIQGNADAANVVDCSIFGVEITA